MKTPSDYTPLQGEEFESRLHAYSSISAVTFATAALATAVPASAQSIINITTTGGLTLSGSSDFPPRVGFTAGPFHGSFVASRLHTSVGGDHTAAGNLAILGNFEGQAAAHSYLKLLAPNAIINNAAGPFGYRTTSGGQIAQHAFRTHSAHVGGFVYGANPKGSFNPGLANGNKVGYVGFQASQGGHKYYGWLRIEVTEGASGRPLSIELDPIDGYTGAYTSGPSILAGVPEPANAAGGLGLLALGAAGVREMRRRRKIAV